MVTEVYLNHSDFIYIRDFYGTVNLVSGVFNPVRGVRFGFEPLTEFYLKLFWLNLFWDLEDSIILFTDPWFFF